MYNSAPLFQFENMNDVKRDLTVNILKDDAETTSYLHEGIISGGPHNEKMSLTMSANALNNQNSYASAGVFGLGFDPDCL